MRVIPLLAVGLGMFLSAGCAAGPRGATAKSKGRNVITAEELARAPTGNALEALQRLRPEYFYNRGESSILNDPTPWPGIVVNGAQIGDLSILRQIPGNHLLRVRFYRASEVPSRYSSEFVNGLIEITTK